MQLICRTIFVTLSLAIAGCSLIPVYYPDVQQGNIITQNDVKQLQLGMTPAQVLYIMGPPILKQNFILNRWDYVYTMKKPRKPMVERRLSLYFEADRLVRIEGATKLRAPALGPVYPAPSMTRTKPEPYSTPATTY